MTEPTLVNIVISGIILLMVHGIIQYIQSYFTQRREDRQRRISRLTELSQLIGLIPPQVDRLWARSSNRMMKILQASPPEDQVQTMKVLNEVFHLYEDEVPKLNEQLLHLRLLCLLCFGTNEPCSKNLWKVGQELTVMLHPINTIETREEQDEMLSKLQAANTSFNGSLKELAKKGYEELIAYDKRD